MEQRLEKALGYDRASLLKRVAAGGAVLSLPALLEAQNAMAAPDVPAAGGGGNYPSHPKWKFAFINHVTTNPFFVPTQYGIQDACALVKCTYSWSGSENAILSQQLAAFNAAVASHAAGIAVTVTAQGPFEKPIANAIRHGIPVVAYNADGGLTGSHNRMAYIGQQLYNSGFAMGQRIAGLVSKGDVALFIATPGALNIQPRIDGAIAGIKKSGKPINPKSVTTGPQVPAELNAIDAYYLAHKSKLKGMFAVDAGSTQGVGQVITKYSAKIPGGGFDLLTPTLQAIQAGHLKFTIDQQPYLQGFYPVMQLFLYKLSGGLMFPSDTNTGLLFVTSANVKPYLTTKSRFEGSSSKQKYPVS
ncbi:MAG: sugar ABC transporter substrate-binding protein [Candidatus Rokuibacteriota bacterium]|nr:MAG: sugar ABC transporter substrate-binding protein [Candidatus Rokubacteria bacterium]